MASIRLRAKHARLGAAAVEFAMIAPLMIMFTFGMIELGRLMMVKNAATQATREGARAASLPFATNQKVLARVTQELELHSIPSPTIETVPENIEDAAPGEVVLVRVKIDPASVSWISGFVNSTVPFIEAESTMRRESTQ